MTPIDFRAAAEALREELIAQRRDFHQHPELAFEEVRTAGIVAQTLNALGLEVQTGIGKTGVIGILDGNQPGPTVLVRADMDALPIHEETGAEYASQTPNKMHACGHDGHTTIALGVAKLLSAHRDQINGRVKFVFQPAEEIAAGARAMIHDGALNAPHPDVSLGLHLWNTLPFGKLGVADGAVMAGSDSFKLTITGKGGHGASPHQTLDPIVCGAQMISALQSIVSRNVNPLETAVLSVTQFHAGSADNIIPQTAVLRGTIRAYSSAVRDLLVARIIQVAEGVATAMGCTVEFDLFESTKPVINDPTVSAQVRQTMLALVDEEHLLLDERTMGAEDVGLFMTDTPGMYFFVGSANAERGLDAPHHHPRFDFDEAVLPFSVALMARAVASYVLTDAV
ncbi:MAG: M20 metallopeptidase family protein [Phototrophicaceae bacterium]